MATINIGNLTFTHKGDYDGSTAYAKNDVVYYATNGNAYIAKQATTGNVPTNATYWNQFAQGSGGIWNAGLSLGTANQELRVNSGGSALEFYTPTAASSDFKKLATQDITTGVSSINFQGIFTSDYDVYRVFASSIQNSTASYERLGLLVGTTLQTSNYHNMGLGLYSSNSDTNQSTHEVAQVDGSGFRTINTWNNGEMSGSRNRSFEATIFNPRCLDNNFPTFHCTCYQYDNQNYRVGYISWGRYTSYSTSIDGLQVNTLSGNMTNGRISVYGIKH